MRGDERRSADADFQRAFRMLASPALVTGTDLEVLEATDAYVSLTNYPREAVRGETPIVFFDDPDRYAAATDALATGDVWQGDVELVTRSDRRVPTRCVARRIADGDDLLGYAFTFHDLTRRRQYEQGIRIFDRVLRHNLRNDANVVLGHLENALDQVDDAGAEAAVEDALGGVERLLRRGETARTFSDVFAAGGPDPLGDVWLDEAVDRAITQAHDSGVAIETDVDRIRVVANDTLVPAVRALVENAVEHNDSETPRVEVTSRVDSDRVLLSVRDNGPGIDPEHHDRAFGRDESSQVAHGDGLSLFFVDRLMELYGGEANAKNVDDGAAFELAFRPADGRVDEREYR
ncbi:ATP-binding protein [Haloparvum sp. AD34]